MDGEGSEGEGEGGRGGDSVKERGRDIGTDTEIAR